MTKINQLQYYLFGIISFAFACCIFLFGILLEEKIMKKLTGKGIIEYLKDIIKYK